MKSIRAPGAGGVKGVRSAASWPAVRESMTVAVYSRKNPSTARAVASSLLRKDLDTKSIVGTTRATL
jgi:hypothetical protein